MHDHDPRPENHDRVLALLGAFLVLGAFTGASATALTLVPAHARAACPGLVTASHVAMVVATSGLAVSGIAFFRVALRGGYLDHRVWRALPLAFFFMGALVAPWTRLALSARTPAPAAACGLVIGLILALSVRYVALGSNRVSRVFAVLNVWQYGVMAAGLALALTAHPPVAEVGHDRPLTDLSACRASAR
jgi:hypothetical protein